MSMLRGPRPFRRRAELQEEPRLEVLYVSIIDGLKGPSMELGERQ